MAAAFGFNAQVNAVPEPVNVTLGVFRMLLGGAQSFRWRRKSNSQSAAAT